MRVSIRLLVVAACGLALGLPDPGEAGRRRSTITHEAAGRLTFASPQVEPIAVSPDGSLVLVASTTSNQVDVIATSTHTLHAKSPVEVGIDPGTVAFRPDGLEAWVSNHVSDSVSVIDTDPTSASFLKVVETIQELDGNGATLFDEPVGIAFKGDGSEAYVALSSRNDVAIVDTTSYEITGRVHITAQEPRALTVLGDLLYVAAFESNNQSELSMCESLSDDTNPQHDCTLDVADIADFAINNPNLPNSIKDIHIDPGAPDRDLFVFDISSGLADGTSPITQTSHSNEAGVPGMGTLLYGMTVTGSGGSDTVFISQTDARNAVNGPDGDNLIDMDNRMFLNQLTRVSCTNGVCGVPTRMDLESLPAPECGGGNCGSDPAAGEQLATPYGIAVTTDASTLVVTAAASSRIFSYDAAGSTDADVLGSLDVGEIPRGLAFVPSGPDTGSVYVLNTLSNSVSVVTLASGGALSLDGSVAVNPIPVGNDPTPSAVRLGRIAFNDADAASTGTFACASCHPDGNTDQLLWRIGGACVACNGDEPRSTMPIRGLRDTVPLHWDGALGDPFGGNNGVDPNANLGPSVTQEGSQTCSLSNQSACFLHLVEGAISGVMCDQAGGGCATGPSGEAGLLDDTERANMATFLESVSYPPARSRPIDDLVTPAAMDGFQDFFEDDPEGRGGPLSNAIPDPTTCADSTAGCHELPLGVGNNSETLGGFDVPTMRGMTDRFLQFSMGLTFTEEILLGMNSDGFSLDVCPFVPQCNPPTQFFVDTISQPFGTWNASMGPEEDFTFGVAFAIFDLAYGGSAVTNFQMFEEASTGHSGALGRQITLNSRTTGGSLLAGTQALLAELEAADTRAGVNLRGSGLLNGLPVTISYIQSFDLYQVGGIKLTSADLITKAQGPVPTLIATLTAHLRGGATEGSLQPLIAAPGSQCDADNAAGTVDPVLPQGLAPLGLVFFEAAHVTALDQVIINGQPAPGASLSFVGASTACAGNGLLTPDGFGISNLPLNVGTNLLQILSNNGLLSNELPVIGQ